MEHGKLQIPINGVDTEFYPETGFDDVLNADGDTLTDTFENINSALAIKAPLTSPSFSGIPTVPTAGKTTKTTQIASTAFVKSQFKTQDLSFTVSYASGTIGARGYYNSAAAALDGYNIVGVTIVASADANYIPVAGVNGNYVVLSLYRATTSALESKTISVRVFYTAK